MKKKLTCWLLGTVLFGYGVVRECGVMGRKNGTHNEKPN
ncbi:MAG: hypothetical protein DVB22_001233 [Verrucomicrobia bacterium]|nr:MAG: hypothetical protein DVB22_001233 [Verrucomicrobiota bacterium]